MTETLVIVAQHQNQYYGRSRAHGASRAFRGINCRTFHSKGNYPSIPVVKKSSLASPKTPSPSVNSPQPETKHFKSIIKSKTISLPIKFKADLHKEGFFNDDFAYSELWAGPTYSNSPSPSSLPIPKFSLCSKTPKSAPPSPSREHKNQSNRNPFHSAELATKTLRRILNLDVLHD